MDGLSASGTVREAVGYGGNSKTGGVLGSGRGRSAGGRCGDASHTAIAAKHGVTEAALKYHFYKARKP